MATNLLLYLTLVICVSFSSTNGEEPITNDDVPELSYMNFSADPCDDFYEYSCGNFKNVYKLAEDELVINHFSILEDEILKLSKEILESPEDPNDIEAVRKIKSLYTACVDTSFSNLIRNPELTVLNDTVLPLVSAPHTIDNLKFSWNDLGKMAADYGLQLIFDVSTYPHLTDKSKMTLLIQRETLYNPTLFRPEHKLSYDQILAEDLKDISTNHKLRRSSKALLPFDIFLQNITYKMRDATRNYYVSDDIIEKNLAETKTFMATVATTGLVDENAEVEEFVAPSITLKQLQTWTDKHFGKNLGLNWVEYISNIFYLSDVKITEDVELIVFSGLHNIIYSTINLVRNTKPEILKNFALLRIFLFMAPDSDAQTNQALEDYFKAKGYLTYPRWEYCTRKILESSTTSGLSFALTHAYERYHFDNNKLQKAADMLNNLQVSFKEMVQEATWMDDISKERALEKAEKMISILGYPDFVQNGDEVNKFYQNLRVCKWDNYGNSRRMRAFRQAYLFNAIDKPRNRATWDKSPMAVNAYYNRPNNKIILPVSMLNPIYYNGDMSIVDYGRIGMILGHEILHGFDSYGRQYDDDGLMVTWWTSETEKKFIEAANCFLDQYSKYYIPETDSYVNATLSLAENLADNGGIRESYRAYKKLRKVRKSGVKDFTDDQLFFIAFGTMFCANETPYYISKNIYYSPARWRINGPLRNMKEFGQAFNCPVGSNMNPQEKCILW